MRPWLLYVLSVAAFGYSVWGEFFFDDLSIFARPIFAPPVTRPLTQLSFWLNGSHPAVFHATNLLLHLLNVWLFRRLTPVPAAAWIFALHPLQAEAVNYVWARSNLLMATFALLAWRDWLREKDWRAVGWFALALLAKEEAVALPLALLLFRRSWRPLSAMLALSATAGAYVVWAAGATAGSQAGARSIYTPLEYLGTQGAVVLRYLQLLIIPYGFTADPDFQVGLRAVEWAGVLVIAAAAYRWTASGRWVLAALILLLPSSSIFPANDLSADRRMYLPLGAIAVWAGSQLRPRWMYAIAAMLAILSFQRTLVWHSGLTLWTEAERQAPYKLRPKLQLARYVPPDEALRLLQEARKIAPDDPAVASELGRAHLNLGQPAEALAEFGKALALTPDDPRALSNRGVALLMLKQTDAARADFEHSLRIDNCAFEARYNLKRMGFPVPENANCRYTEWQRSALDEVR